MWSYLFENGGRKFWLVLAYVVIAVLNDVLKLGVSEETLRSVLYAVLGGSGTIALEDGLRALLGVKGEANDLLVDDEKEVEDAK